MTREEALGQKGDESLEVAGVNGLVNDIYDDFENKSCTTCKWCKEGGEFASDECWNTSLSGHLSLGTAVSDDFCCNRWEEKI